MNTPDSHDERAWLKGLGLDPSAENASPEVVRDAAVIHRLLRALPPDGPVDEALLAATEARWRQDEALRGTRPASPVPAPGRRSGSPAARPGWKLWFPGLVAVASFLVVLMRPLVVETGMHWSSTVAASVFKDMGSGVDSHAARQRVMDDWMKGLQASARDAFRAAGLGRDWSVRAALTDDPDGTLVLRLSLEREGGPSHPEWVEEFAGPADGSAATAARAAAVRRLVETALAGKPAPVP